MQKIKISDFFWIALAISIVGLVTTAILNAPPLLVFGFGFAPLLAYHVRLFAEVKSGASQSAIDSVYYFGFIVTIATLATSVLLVAARGVTKDISYIVNQFGLGLVATGYALFARMHLMAIAERMDEGKPEQIVDEYIHKVKRVVDQVELSALSFESLANNLMKRSEESALASRRASEGAVRSAADMFSLELKKAVDEARGGIDEFAKSLKTFSLGSEAQDLRNQMRSMGTALVSISARLKTFEKSISTVGDDFGRTAVATENLSASMKSASAGVAEVSTLSAELGKVRQTFQLVAHHADAMQDGVSQLDARFARLVADMDKSLSVVTASLEKSSQQSGESVDRLASHLARLVDFIISETRKKHGTQ